MIFAAAAWIGQGLRSDVIAQVGAWRDRASRLWLAACQLQAQADVGWRINGCAVVPDAGKSSI